MCCSGAYNPSGRLTVSWPQNGATYPNAYNEPGSSGRRYGFGHGLSYTTFTTSRLKVPDSIKAGHGTVPIKVTLRNTGARGGARTVLAIAEKLSGSGWLPRQLVAFKRTWLPPRGSAKIQPVVRRGPARAGHVPARRRRRVAGDPRALSRPTRRASQRELRRPAAGRSDRGLSAGRSRRRCRW